MVSFIANAAHLNIYFMIFFSRLFLLWICVGRVRKIFEICIRFPSLSLSVFTFLPAMFDPDYEFISKYLIEFTYKSLCEHPNENLLTILFSAAFFHLHSVAKRFFLFDL